MALARSARQYTGVRAIQPPDLTITDRPPVSTDTAYVPGQLWMDKTNLASWQWSGTTWIAFGTGSTGSINTITGDTGGAEVPLAGNFSLLGTANQITVTGASNKETFSLSATLIAPGSIVATTTIRSTTTMTAGTGFTATTGNIVASTGNITSTLGSVAAATTVTGGTGVVATTGNVTATNGNIVRGTAGNKDVYTNVATTTTAGDNSAGTVTLVAGEAVVATTAVTANSQIRIYRQGVGATGAAALGILSILTRVAATSFTIRAVQPADATAAQVADVSVVAWEIVN